MLRHFGNLRLHYSSEAAPDIVVGPFRVLLDIIYAFAKLYQLYCKYLYPQSKIQFLLCPKSKVQWVTQKLQWLVTLSVVLGLEAQGYAYCKSSKLLGSIALAKNFCCQPQLVTLAFSLNLGYAVFLIQGNCKSSEQLQFLYSTRSLHNLYSSSAQLAAEVQFKVG